MWEIVFLIIMLYASANASRMKVLMLITEEISCKYVILALLHF